MNAHRNTHLRHIDPTHRPGWFTRTYSRMAERRSARFISRHVAWKVDPILLRATRGRIATTLVFPTAVLQTRGARTGAARRNAIIYFNDGDSVVVAASNAGSPTHPAWYHNVLAHPDVVFGGVPMRARVVDDAAEQRRLWDLADNVFPAFATYRREATAVQRTIPLIKLAAADDHSLR